MREFFKYLWTAIAVLFLSAGLHAAGLPDGAVTWIGLAFGMVTFPLIDLSLGDDDDE